MEQTRKDSRGIEHREGRYACTFRVNGEEVTVAASPMDRVVDLLRDQLHKTGTKISCGIGRCGACSIWVDGRLTSSCLLLAYQVEGKEVTTIEGMGTEERCSIVQEAFMNEGGFQCGYCTPGMIMAAESLLRHIPDPDDEEIREGLAGNICRCTGYSGIIRAVKAAAANLQ